METLIVIISPLKESRKYILEIIQYSWLNKILHKYEVTANRQQIVYWYNQSIITKKPCL